MSDIRPMTEVEQQLWREVGQLRRELAEARAAIRWALGEGDDFPTREPGQGAYWWRTELRRRAFGAAAEPQDEANG